MMPWLNIISVGEEGRRPAADPEIDDWVGGIDRRRRAASRDAGRGQAETQSWATRSKTVDEVPKRRGHPVVILATGDPMHFGIGVTLARGGPPRSPSIRISAFTLAASRLAWPWPRSSASPSTAGRSNC